MAECVAIIDYGSGNLRSVQKAFERVVSERGLDAYIVVTGSADAVAGADRIVLPGVGAFAACRAGLDAAPGMIAAMEKVVLQSRRPFLGICVGMQLLATRGLEFGETPGLGWIAGDVKKIEPADPTLSVPHMGWNNVSAAAPHPVIDDLDLPQDFYFANSFHFDVEREQEKIAVCDHGGPLSAGVARDNIVGVQFHPEKSQRAGLALIAAFLTWTPS
ncbi:MAG: imidazole glycerol phosphate synthase subunit HisH [Pseudomonadota bacterium]